MLSEEIRVWVKDHKPNTSMIAGKLADYQQARKIVEDNQVEDNQGRSKEKLPEGGKCCLVCCMIGHLARECPNKVNKMNIRSSNSIDEHHNITRKESRQALCASCMMVKVTLQNNVSLRQYSVNTGTLHGYPQTGESYLWPGTRRIFHRNLLKSGVSQRRVFIW